MVLILLTTNACAMTNNSSNSKEPHSQVINFADYKDIKSLEKYLNEAYPAGSSTDKMVEDMKKAGARCVGVGGSIFRGRKEIIDENKIVCEIPRKQKSLMYEWDWAIHVYKTNDKKIKSIRVEREYFGV